VTDVPPKKSKSVAKTVAIAVMLFAVAIGIGVVAMGKRQARTSEVVVERWDALGGSHWLKANLQDATVIVPDRPHAKSEFNDDWTGFTTRVERTRSFTVRTNNHRLRGGPVGEKQGLRIISLGDSVTHGWGVDEQYAYPARLQVALGEAGFPAQVLNAGVPANRISGMIAWCESQAKALKPDWIIWTRRPGFDDPPPYNLYVDAVQRCARATGARILVVLPPISAFDLHGGRVWQQEQQGLTGRLRPKGFTVLELTQVFREKATGRGEVLVTEGQVLKVADQESDKIWLEIPLQGEHLPQAVYDLFEDEKQVREALFFDDGHPDQEGYDLFARTVAAKLVPLLRRGKADTVRAPGPPVRRPGSP
jgi:lysophospholipase L1-like esterase